MNTLAVARDRAAAVAVEIPDADLAGSIPVEVFKSAFRLHPGGVALVTADAGRGPAAMTISSLSSVSTEPPLLVFSASALSSSFPVFAEAETVVVHMLSSDDLGLAQLGATSGVDRFADASRWTRLPSGEPVFPEAFAWLRGRVVQRIEAGNSVICLVHVIGASVVEDEQPPVEASEPLVYHARTWHRLGPHTAIRP
jgi:flavin reductase (DIM6/NTAB) family NADH-FMN oxidoreductase RutF